MIVRPTEEVRTEILRMTREIATQEEENFRITACIEKRMIVAPEKTEMGSANIPELEKLFPGQTDKIPPLAALGHRIGLGDTELSAFLLRMLPCTTIYSAKELSENPYFKKIRTARVEEGKFRFEMTQMLPGELFFDREPVPDGYGRINCVGMFDGSLSYPAFYEKDRCWMSITPNEIVTMKDSLQKASGKVLTLGLGLGYYAYMAHLKEDVESVTVVEREADVIRLFEEALLPQFDYPEKIHILRADAFDYLKRISDGDFDYCFADIWQNPLEGMDDYLQTKRLGNRFSHMACDYWIEESFIGCLELSAAIALQFACLGEDDSPMHGRPGYTAVKELLQDVEISSAEDVRRLFGGAFLRGKLAQLR